MITKWEIITCLNELKLDVINITPTHCTVCIPSHRSSDLKNSADIIEDIARIYNFGNFNSQLPTTSYYGSISRHGTARQRGISGTHPRI